MLGVLGIGTLERASYFSLFNAGGSLSLYQILCQKFKPNKVLTGQIFLVNLFNLFHDLLISF